MCSVPVAAVYSTWRIAEDLRRGIDHFFLSGRWVRAEPAAVLEFLLVLLDLRTFEAAVPAFFDVVSFLAMNRSTNRMLTALL